MAKMAIKNVASAGKQRDAGRLPTTRPLRAGETPLPGPSVLPIHPGRIGFDIDGVVADTMEAFIRIAREEHGVTVHPEEITAFQVEECLDMDPAVVEGIFRRLLEDPLGNGLKLMPHAGPVLRDFARHAPLTFVTARPLAEPIAEWLRVMLGEETAPRIRLIATGEHDDKTRHIKEMGLSHFIDDRAQTCLMLEEEGLNPIVFRQPWNQGRHRLPEVDNWLAIRALCLPREDEEAREAP
jgi:5'(3')-deoxyribonucleotidase